MPKENTAVHAVTTKTQREKGAEEAAEETTDEAARADDEENTAGAGTGTVGVGGIFRRILANVLKAAVSVACVLAYGKLHPAVMAAVRSE